ncbi:MAG: hypothetical protein ABIJ94_01465 [candidate division WOR-3 bacterium]
MNNNNLKLKNTKNIQRGCQNVPFFIFHFSLNARSLTLLILTVSLFVFLYSTQPINAAVPVWVVGFDNNTDYEKSLEVFLFNLMQAIQERNEDFQMSFKLAQIEKAREDVNKLMYEAFTELRSEPLLLEFHEINKYCAKTPFTTGLPGEENVGSKVCTWYDEVIDYLKGRGLTIITAPFDKDNPLPAGQNQDPLCINGVLTTEGECVQIKLEGRIITNPDNFIYEEPLQKARDFVMCYLAPWRHFPFEENKELSDQKRDTLKKYFLFDIARRMSYVDVAPPETWYTPARCEKIMARLGCPKIAGYGSTASEDINPNDPNVFLAKTGACQFKAFENEPQLKKPLDPNWTWGQFLTAVQDQNSTFAGVTDKIRENINKIIDQYEKLRTAQYIAGQGIRPEKYLIGYRAYDEETYKRLLAAVEKEGLGAENENSKDAPKYTPIGDYFYYDTEDIISPAVILLNKIAAATQAEFDMARDAFKVRPSQENIAYIERDITNEPGFVAGRLGADRRWISVNFESNNTNRVQNPPTSVETFGPGLGPTMGGLLAPFEDTGLKLDESYLNKDNPPWIEGNYFSQWYKDILQLHNYNFGTIVKDWFGKPEKAYFIPDR